MNNWKAEVINYYFDKISLKTFYLMYCSNPEKNYGWYYVLDDDYWIWYDGIYYDDECKFPLLDAMHNYYNSSYPRVNAQEKGYNKIQTLKAACDTLVEYQKTHKRFTIKEKQNGQE